MAAGPWIPLLLFNVDSNKGTCYKKMYSWITGVKNGTEGLAAGPWIPLLLFPVNSNK
jgi:hypothetical protein